MRTLVAVSFVLLSAALRAAVPCPCDPHDPDTLKERPCSLCAVAEKATAPVVFIQDASPSKPDRWLAIPRQHSPGLHEMSALPQDIRNQLWQGAIDRAKELWGDAWGIAYNAEPIHTQCHVHIHIGKLLDGVEWGEFKVIEKAEDIPLPGKNGLWIHPVAGKLHVHTGEQVTENVLLR
jgi:diadenosine tetraphosphate (Ap4A) HIT family hydrolase